jgi:ATP-dependent DNA helicase RecQ
VTDPRRRPPYEHGGGSGWEERWDCPGWRTIWTTAGGRFREGDVIAPLRDGLRGRIARNTSQALLAVTLDGRTPPVDPLVRLWIDVSRKILQRGSRPPISRSAAEIIHGIVGGTDGIDPTVFERAASWSAPGWQLASTYELHAAYEKPLWDEIVRQLPGVARWFIPQVPLHALGRRHSDEPEARWGDFLYCAPWLSDPVVIEVDGRQHERRSGADRVRDDLLRKSGLRVERLEGDATGQWSARLLDRLRSHEVARLAPPVDMRAVRLLHGPATMTRLALAIVEAVAAGLLEPGSRWSIEVEDELDLGPELVGAALDPLRAIAEIWDAQVVPDEVVVNGRMWVMSGERAQSAGLQLAQPDLRIRLQPTTPYFAALPLLDQLPEIVVRGAGVPVDLGWLSATIRTRRLVPKDRPIESALRLLVQDIFGLPDFRPGQLAAIRQVLSGGDAVVLLPTGAGKTLIYQMAGLVLAGATVVVDPLVSLIDDQAARLERDGIDRVAAMHSTRLEAPGERDRVLGALSRGEILFVLATPERFQSKRFRDHLQQATTNSLIAATVIDETHCVSEWGHDFRTSYLRLARTLRERCRDASGVAAPLLALTGTASPGVLRDVLRELGIDERADGALQRPPNHDRPNLRYEIVRTVETGRLDSTMRVLFDRVPDYLGAPPSELGALRGLNTVAGIVFAPHVNGKYGISDMATSIVSEGVRRNAPIEVVTYAGGAPEGSEDRWDEEKAENVGRFMANDASLLVGTKAFGMGIDKPNIRFTIHSGIPSSLEAFAQEAGRAGRDGGAALCSLVGIVPEQPVVDWLLDAAATAEERRARANGSDRERPGGDVRRQAWFLANSFPGVDQEVTAALEVLSRLGDPPPSGGTITIPMPRDFGGIGDKAARQRIREKRSATDRGLYRLTMMGFIADLTVDATEVTVEIAQWTASTLDVALVEYLDRIEPGRHDAHLLEVAEAPDELGSRIEHHLRTLIAATYRIVARARLEALRFMVDTVAQHDSPEDVRTRITTYLGGGPVALALDEVVRGPEVDVRRFVELLSAIPVREQVDIAASAARQLEAYPEHPLLLLAAALGESRVERADRSRFAAVLFESVAQFGRYGVGAEEAALSVLWLVGRLRSENGGRCSAWAVEVLNAWDAAGLPSELIAPIESGILEDVTTGYVPAADADSVRRRRMRRHIASANELADRLTPVTLDGGRDD